MKKLTDLLPRLPTVLAPSCIAIILLTLANILDSLTTRGYKVPATFESTLVIQGIIAFTLAAVLLIARISTKSPEPGMIPHASTILGGSIFFTSFTQLMIASTLDLATVVPLALYMPFGILLFALYKQSST